MGGVFIATHMLKPPGELIELSVFLPDREEPLRVEGQVRWIREFNEASDVPPGMGVRFTDLSEEDQKAIEAFLAQRAPIFFDDEESAPDS